MFWHDGVALCSRAIAVTKDNAFAHNNLGAALAGEGRSAEAMLHYREALRINPNYTLARNNLGVELAAAGQLDEAALQMSEALKRDPHSEVVHNNLGVILAKEHNLDSAVQHFKEAIQLNPQYCKAYLNYAVALQQEGLAGLALTNYQRSLELSPTWPQALDKLAFLLATYPTPEYHDAQRAVKLASRANELTFHVVPAYLGTLAIAYAAAGQFSNAIATAEQARGQALRKGAQDLADRLTHDLEFYRSARRPELDWRNLCAGEMESKPKGPPLVDAHD
jgi:spermidine synthase